MVSRKNRRSGIKVSKIKEKVGKECYLIDNISCLFVCLPTFYLE